MRPSVLNVIHARNLTPQRTNFRPVSRLRVGQGVAQALARVYSTVRRFHCPNAVTAGTANLLHKNVLTSRRRGVCQILKTTPLPTTLPLFPTGLGALGLIGCRRKKKAAENPTQEVTMSMVPVAVPLTKLGGAIGLLRPYVCRRSQPVLLGFARHRLGGLSLACTHGGLPATKSGRQRCWQPTHGRPCSARAGSFRVQRVRALGLRFVATCDKLRNRLRKVGRQSCPSPSCPAHRLSLQYRAPRIRSRAVRSTF